MVLCYGGSGGSEEINDAMRLVIENMVKEDVAFIFATGKVYYEEFIESIKDIELKPYQRVMPYLDNMADGLAASDIVIGSAGAISLAEITALGKPSIIIPKAYTAENHQEYNAKSIESQGAGIAILEKDLTPERLNEVVKEKALKQNQRFLNQVVDVLVDGPSKRDETMMTGYTAHQKLINFKGRKEDIGKIVPVKVTEVKTWALKGEQVD